MTVQRRASAASCSAGDYFGEVALIARDRPDGDDHRRHGAPLPRHDVLGLPAARREQRRARLEDDAGARAQAPGRRGQARLELRPPPARPARTRAGAPRPRRRASVTRREPEHGQRVPGRPRPARRAAASRRPRRAPSRRARRAPSSAPTGGTPAAASRATPSHDGGDGAGARTGRRSTQLRPPNQPSASRSCQRPSWASSGPVAVTRAHREHRDRPRARASSAAAAGT